MIRLKKVTMYRPAPLENENHCLVDIAIEEVEVKLSVWWWIEGKGFIKELRMKGARGVVDRRTEKPNPNYVPKRREWQRGDFEFTSFAVYDMLIQLHYPDTTFRPVTISIFSLQCGLFRKQWLLYDLLHAHSIVGVFDGCLFNFGNPQHYNMNANSHVKKEVKSLKLDGLNMDLLSKNASGPLGWIEEGTLDISMNISVPIEVPESENYYPQELEDYSEEDDEHTLDVQVQLQLNHIRVNPPLYSSDISWLNLALVHPISRYMNLHSKHMKLKFSIALPQRNFDGSWTPNEAKIWDALSLAVYKALIEEAYEQRKSTSLKQLLRYIWMLLG